MEVPPNHGEGKTYKGKGRTLEEAILAAAQNESLVAEVHGSSGGVVLLSLSQVQVLVSNPNIDEYRVVLTDPTINV